MGLGLLQMIMQSNIYILNFCFSMTLTLTLTIGAIQSQTASPCGPEIVPMIFCNMW